MVTRPEQVWGIRPAIGVTSIPQRFALVAGAIYVVIGLIGFFITGFDNFTEPTHEAMFGIHLTPFHNLAHVGIGALWLIAALTLTRPGAEGVCFAIGGFYLLAAILGYTGNLSLLGIVDPLDPANFFHAATGLISVAFCGIIPWPSLRGEI